MSTTESETSATWLTREAYERLETELAALVTNRPVIAAEINARREEGDLKENGGYHAAREEQGKQEGRIRQVQHLLRTARVSDAPATVTEIGPGTVVTVEFDGDPDDTETFLLGSREIAATTDLTVYSPESALGSAIAGHGSGDVVTYAAPTGADISVRIVSIAPFTG